MQINLSFLKGVRGNYSGTLKIIESSINTIEKLYLWCYYQLSSTTEKIEIEGEKEYLVDSELIRLDGVDPRLFLVTKMILPFKEEWVTENNKLWENVQEIKEGNLTINIYDQLNYCEQDLSTLQQINYTPLTYAIGIINGYCEQDLSTLQQINYTPLTYAIGIINGYCEQNLSIL